MPRVERDIAEGGEILHRYGVLSDAQLLQTYGFVPILPAGVSNPDNSLPIPAADVMACCQRPCSQVRKVNRPDTSLYRIAVSTYFMHFDMPFGHCPL